MAEGTMSTFAMRTSQPGAVQLLLAEMSTDTVMRIFDSLQANYKLSVPYVARTIRLDGRADRRAERVRTADLDLKPKVTP